jgi:hydrogenase nickel incorporation protein HypA/HybF
MHEFGLMQSVLDNADKSAREAGAVRITDIRLVIGEMREVIPDSMDFAFEALSPNTLSENAVLHMTMISPRSRCTQCGHEFEHERFRRSCPKCDSLVTELIAGKELYIDAIEVEMPE